VVSPASVNPFFQCRSGRCRANPSRRGGGCLATKKKKKLPRPGSPRRVGTCAAAAQHSAARMICRAEPGPSTTRQGPRPAARRRPVFLVRKSLPSSVAIIGAHQLTTVCRFPGLIDPDTQDDFFTRWCLLSNPGRVR
jgi:hypothetical protein